MVMETPATQGGCWRRDGKFGGEAENEAGAQSEYQIFEFIEDTVIGFQCIMVAGISERDGDELHNIVNANAIF